MYDEYGNPIDSGTWSDFSDASVGPGGGFDTSSPIDLGSIGGMLPVGLFGGGASPSRTAIAGAAGAVGRALGRGFGSIMVAGRAVPVKRLWDITKKFGPEVAAAAVGYGVADLMAIFASSGVISSGSRRRRRGISSRDIRTTKRVVRFVNRMSHDIGCVHRPHIRSARRASA